MAKQIPVGPAVRVNTKFGMVDAGNLMEVSAFLDRFGKQFDNGWVRDLIALNRAMTDWPSANIVENIARYQKKWGRILIGQHTLVRYRCRSCGLLSEILADAPERGDGIAEWNEKVLITLLSDHARFAPPDCDGRKIQVVR